MRHIIMNRTSNLFLYFLVVLLPLSVHGEIPVTLPDDQQISLETDQPNRHVDNSDRTGSAVGGNIEQATLFVDRKMERGNSCNFTLRLRNTTSFRIRNVVPQFSAIIQNNVVFATISAEFFEIGPSSTWSLQRFPPSFLRSDRAVNKNELSGFEEYPAAKFWG